MKRSLAIAALLCAACGHQPRQGIPVDGGADLASAPPDLATSARDLGGGDAAAAMGLDLLLADSGEGTIYLLALDGATIASYPSPVAGLTGVAHDRRAGDGFWVVGRGQPYTFYKLDWQGKPVRQVQNVDGANGTAREWQVVDGDVRGLDYFAAPAAADDALAFVKLNVNLIDTSTTIRVSDGSAMSSAGFFVNSQAQNGYWGCSLFAHDNGSQHRFCTHAGSTIERFLSGSYETGFAIPAGDPRGIAPDGNGDFFVVDRAAARVLLVDPNGAVLRSFATPGATPEGLSFGAGPTANPIS